MHYIVSLLMFANLTEIVTHVIIISGICAWSEIVCECS